MEQIVFLLVCIFGLLFVGLKTLVLRITGDNPQPNFLTDIIIALCLGTAWFLFDFVLESMPL